MWVVLDTSVLIAAARSRRGASFALISEIPSPRFQICFSVPLYAEWQDVLTRPEHLPSGQTTEDALIALRALATHAHLQDIYFLWRPMLRDPDDDMVFELAMAAACRYVVTHNVGDFAPTAIFGIDAILPGDFLRLLQLQ